MNRSLAPSTSIAPEGRDAYADLLRDTRGLRREQAHEREAWFGTLTVERKEDLLFELEVLLKGIACFSNPRNHPGPPRRAPVVAQDFKNPLALTREALHRVVHLCRVLHGEGERAFVFQRYLETVLPDDRARTKLINTEGVTQSSPGESLYVLRHGLAHVLEVANGAARLPRVPYRFFYSLLGLAQREIARSVYFNPLNALEFRPEFDRITNAKILDLTRSVPQDQARRLVALCFLSLFRMLRYLSLVEHAARDTGDGRRASGAIYLVMSVLRSDARALSGYLRHRAGPLLAEAYERDLLRVPATDIAQRYESILVEGHRLLETKATLEGVSANLRLELGRAFDHDFPSPENALPTDKVRDAALRAVRNLRPSLQNAVLFLAKSIGGRADAARVFDDDAARRALSERLRRDVWMFAQIVRAFAHKARAVPTGEVRWTGMSPLSFVREFLAYFRAMGYPLLRNADYPRVDAFMDAMSALEETDLLDPVRLARATDEAEQFFLFLTDLFERIGQRDELVGVAFDRRGAAEALKLYLGAS